jgi:hypothetical protein
MNLLTRRDFSKWTGKVLLLFSAGTSALFLGGCNVFNDILTWIPIGLTALQGIVTVLGPLMPPGAAAIIVLIKATFADLSAAISEYNADANPTDKATLLAKIRTFLSDIVNNFQTFFNALNIGNNPILNIVIGLANVILAAIEGFMGQLPATGTKTLTTSFHVGARQLTVTPKFYNRVSDFKHDYNAVAAAAGHPEISIH